MNESILNNDVQHFINSHLKNDSSKLILKGSPFQGLAIQEIVEQIESKKKCEKKLPTWYNANTIYYPNKLNIEQTSSEITAKYKSELIFGNSIIDITGGFGVDCFYFSKKFDNVIHCELNEELSNIVSYNFKELDIKNVKLKPINGLIYLEKYNQKFDWIYADPSRRDDSKGKVFLLNDCLPNIPENLVKLFKYSDNILLKVSPLLDLTSTINELNYVKEIHIVAVKNEVKEFLIILEKGYNEDISIKTINFKTNDHTRFSSTLNLNSTATYSLPKNFLYEPNSAILKAGLFNEVSENLNVEKLHNNSHLYTSEDLIDFPGRRFKIVHISSFDKKKLEKIIPTKQANITTRNFPETVSRIRKKIGFKDGGEIYLFFTTNIQNKPIVLVCQKV